jgi:hypothetical protein
MSKSVLSAASIFRSATIALLLGIAVAPLRGQTSESARPSSSPAPVAIGAVYSLEQFGSGLASPVQAQDAFDAACKQILAKGGGVLMIPSDASAGWQPRNDPQQHRTGPGKPPERSSVGVTVIDLRGGTAKILPPQISGLAVSRTLDLPVGQSLPHWDYYPMLDLRNAVARGSTSYRDQIAEDFKAGVDTRIYVNTIRGLFPGMFLNCESYGPGGVQRLYIKTLGYDPSKSLWYFTADTTSDVKKGTYLSNKNHVNIARLQAFSHAESQSSDLVIHRNNYSQGDNYLIDARFKYMGDVHSTGGDENGVIFAGFIETIDNIFRGDVKSWDPKTGELVYGAGKNLDTLGAGRPIINLNTKKWITTGNAVIVQPASFTEPDGHGLVSPVFQGKSYPTTRQDAAGGTGSFRMGGLIRLSADSPVDAQSVGRYFAVDEEGEYVPPSTGAGAVRRWYLIDQVVKNADGTKDLRIVRYNGIMSTAGAPTLYKVSNYSLDGAVKPLKYIIAPGVNAYDVADGIENKTIGFVSTKRLLRLSPSPFVGSDVDFAAGDSIEQAIGADPVRPVPFRSVIMERIPGAFPAPIFDISNIGIMRDSMLAVRGGKGVLDEDLAKRYDRSPVWGDVIRIEATSRIGINISGDTLDSAIQFQQRNGRAQAVKWKYGQGTKEATLTVSPTDGVMKYEGNGVNVGGSLLRLAGLSGTDVAAKNLRGVSVPVKPGSGEISIKFAASEADANYAVFIETSWLTARGVVRQTPDGFSVGFDKPAPQGASIHWIIVR